MKAAEPAVSDTASAVSDSASAVSDSASAVSDSASAVSDSASSLSSALSPTVSLNTTWAAEVDEGLQGTPLRVAFETFGCRSNYADTVDLQLSLVERGAIPCSFDSEADVYVINTCTVT